MTDQPGSGLTIEYPALFTSASEASKRGKRTFQRLTLLELALVLGGLVLAVLASISLAQRTQAHTGMTDPWSTVAAISTAATFFAALVVKLINRAGHYDDDWYVGRAVAESVRGEAFRYMMRVAPYQTDDADRAFGLAIGQFLKRAEGIRQGVDRLPARPSLITPSMRAVHDLDLTGRREAYLNARIGEQIDWYSKSSAKHRRSERRWFALTVFFQLAAAVFAFLAVHLAVDDEAVGSFFLRIMSLCGALVLAFTAWTQLNRDEELSKAYAISLQELVLVSDAVERADSDDKLNAAVNDAEAVLARENKSWAAKRAAPIDDPDFVVSD